LGYLEDVIKAQRLSDPQVNSLRALRDELQGVLSGGWKTGDPNFYYGGSYAKHTMVKASYDLDLVLYFPPNSNFTVQVLYESVESRLKNRGYITDRHNVAIRLPYKGGIHVDVVPGRALDDTYLYANLFASDSSKTKQTSIKKHIDLVRKNGGYQEVIKLLKLWKIKHGLRLPTFALELATEKALAGNRGDLENRFWTMLLYLRDFFKTARLVDPANSANIVSDELSSAVKDSVSIAASMSCSKKTWQEII
jgi:hypothetical protein